MKSNLTSAPPVKLITPGKYGRWYNVLHKSDFSGRFGGGRVQRQFKIFYSDYVQGDPGNNRISAHAIVGTPEHKPYHYYRPCSISVSWPFENPRSRQLRTSVCLYVIL